MNSHEQQRHADAFLRSGRHFAAPKRDGSGNVQRLEPIPWTQAVVEIMRRTGWVLLEDCPADSARIVGAIGEHGTQPKEGD
ncbi:MAG: hypothetical protein WC718_17620 [Phycisphaerales bacterium]|jgi:hypothetical protein